MKDINTEEYEEEFNKVMDIISTWDKRAVIAFCASIVNEELQRLPEEVQNIAVRDVLRIMGFTIHEDGSMH